MSAVEFDIVDEEGAVVKTFFMRKMTVGASNRKYKLFEQIRAKKLETNQENQQLFCAALVCVLANADNSELVYPPSNDDYDDAVDRLIDEMEEDHLNVISEVYSEINPVLRKLSAKKKKS